MRVRACERPIQTTETVRRATFSKRTKECVRVRATDETIQCNIDDRGPVMKMSHYACDRMWAVRVRGSNANAELHLWQS